MEEKIEKVKEILKKQKQEQLLDYGIEQKEEVLDSILAINFEQLDTLYKKATTKEEIPNTKISPISYIEKETLANSERQKYEKIGENLIKQGKYAVVTMAGGQRNKVRA